MKYKHTITIADIQMNIVTEEEPEVVEAMVGVLDRRMREIFLKTENRCPKIEAALLCALDYCAERNKLQETVNRMEEERRGIDIPAMLAEVEELKGENEKLTMQLTYTEDQARTMKSGIDIANDQIRILKTQVDEAAAAANATAAELDEAKKNAGEAAELKGAVAELESKVAELEAALAEKNTALESKEAECEAKTAECTAKAEEYDKLCEAFEKLSEKIEELTEEVDDLGDDLEDCVEEIVENLAEDGDETVTVEIIAEDTIDGQPVISAEIVAKEADGEPELADDINMMVEEVVEEAAEETAEVVEEITEEAAEEKTEEPAKRPVAEIADNIVDAFELDMKPLRRGNLDENQLTIDSELTEDKPSEKTNVEKEKQKAHKRVRSMFDLITFDNV